MPLRLLIIATLDEKHPRRADEDRSEDPAGQAVGGDDAHLPGQLVDGLPDIDAVIRRRV
jgi:hypothetical protein